MELGPSFRALDLALWKVCRFSEARFAAADEPIPERLANLLFFLTFSLCYVLVELVALLRLAEVVVV